MIDLYGVLQEQETINGELGLGVDYYKGEKGDTPIKGVDYLTPDDVKEISDKVLEKVEAGTKGEDGKSAYQIALDEGFEGSETEWLASLKGADGRNGIDGINGTNGKDGTNGINGKTPVKGVDYFTQAEIQQIENNAAAKVDLSDYTKSADLSSVATSGSYNDLKDKPSIPAAYELPVASATALGGVKVGSGLSITDGVLSATGGGTADSVDWSKIQNKPNFANVATSGDYNDLSNKPTIPSVEGLASEAYVNEKVAAIVIPEVPTKVSELENDKGYLTEHQSLEGYAKTADLAQVAKTGSYNDLIDKPTIPSTTGLATETYVDDKIAEIDIPTVPTKVSAFTNDAGYLTEHQSLIEYAKKTDIPAPYTLPTASTSTLGGVKVDGTTTTVDSYGNLSMIGKPAVTKTLITGRAPDWVVDWVANPDKYIVIVNNCVVFKTEKSDTNFWYYWIDNDRIEHYYITFTDTTFTTPNSSQPSYSMAATQLITADNWQNYITAGGGSDWQYTNNQYNSDLYNVKEMVISVQDSNGNNQMGYFNFGESNLGSGYQGQVFYFDYNTSSPCIQYDGTYINLTNYTNLDFIAYKT